MEWQVTYNGTTKYYASMRTAMVAVERLRRKGIEGHLSQLMGKSPE